MPDLTALHEARAALDQHLSRLSSEAATAVSRRSRRPAPRRRMTMIAGAIAVLLAGAAFLPGAPQGGPSGSIPARPSVGGASLALTTPAGWKGDKAVIVRSSGPREVVRRPAGDAPQPPRATPAPPMKVASLLQPDPPGRYDFEQESAVTGTINPPTPAARPIAAEGKTPETGKVADAGTAADAQARPADPSTPSPKAVGTRRRAKAARQTTPVVVQRVGSGVAKLFAWVMPTRSSR